MALGSVFLGVFWCLQKVLAPERKHDKFLAFLASTEGLAIFERFGFIRN